MEQGFRGVIFLSGLGITVLFTLGTADGLKGGMGQDF
jgi:hypothetical protein